MPGVRSNWKFSWKELYDKEDFFFQLLYKGEIQGLLKLSLKFGEMISMDNVEIAPHNYGSKGKYELVAECLIAYACLFAFKEGKNNYIGFLTFESKTKLVDYYIEKYGAESAMRTTMFIPPQPGKNLIKKFLKITL